MILYGSGLGLLLIHYGCVAEFSCGNPNSGDGVVSDSFDCSWNPLPPTGLPHTALIGGHVFSLTVTCYPRDAFSFLKGNRGGGRSGGEGKGTGRRAGG